MRKFWLTMLLTGLWTVADGCVARPRLLGPGPAPRQQARAQLFEPYPENEPGPAITGARPREYANPRAEVLRVQPRFGEPLLVPGPQNAPR